MKEFNKTVNCNSKSSNEIDTFEQINKTDKSLLESSADMGNMRAEDVSWLVGRYCGSFYVKELKILEDSKVSLKHRWGSRLVRICCASCKPPQMI